jgi:regulatory protein
MISRGIEASVADEVIERYREVGLIDDTALAAAITRPRHREKGHARRAIREELRRKGFEEQGIEAALEEVTDDDEREAAASLAARRWAALKGLPEDARIRRVVDALGRKGYPPGVAFSLVRALKDADIWDNPRREAASAKEE